MRRKLGSPIQNFELEILVCDSTYVNYATLFLVM